MVTDLKANQFKQKDYRSNSLWRLTLRRIFRQRSAIFGMALLGFLIFIAIFADVIAPYDPIQPLIGIENVSKREAPCIHLFGCSKDRPQHIMGIDGNVRDQFTSVSPRSLLQFWLVHSLEQFLAILVDGGITSSCA